MEKPTTTLSPHDESLFQQWVTEADILDVDHPQSFYDYRGYWRDVVAAGRDETAIGADRQRHFPDTYKQPGHPTFSVESQYSQGPNDGGRWAGERFIPPGSDLLGTSRRDVPQGIGDAVRILMNRGN